MTIIDVHTHMLSQEYVDLLVAESGTYTLSGGVVHRAGASFLTLTPGMFDYDLRLAAMDRAGVDIAIVSLTCPSVYWGGPEVSERAARLTNDQMAAAQRRHPDRIRFLATLPWQYPERAVAELKRATDLGAVGVMVLANIDGVSLTDARFADIWAAIDEAELPVLLHPTTPPGVEAQDMGGYHLVWSVGFMFDTTLALSRMILSGFFDRYPRLKVIGGHAGGCLPFLMGRLDAGHRSWESVRASISDLPGSYADRILVDSICYDPRALELTVSVFGPDNVLYGSDFPHRNGHMEEIIGLVRGLPGDQAGRVLGGNAARVFRL
ncbi:amidohydrolase family protein [Spongiactinospora sp. TRM90649]|uniref:amidohydrolase family protein n=1 Tax=Spongiactinospora sp. TRM90649 TaxID=3031114 RepID=UPI0023F9F2BB|nr:amidohydrolase family protein [Spongiactinospora sp. TRM90649]MDF5756945.1 amidohydrolase family protein [Spongiactinospora sp. TRM90649]